MRKSIMIALAMLGCVAPVHAHEPPADGEIRTLRAQSNAAIAAHDIVAAKKLYADDYTVLPGSSGTPLSIDDFTRRLTSGFADPTFLTYVRTPGPVIVSESGKRAAEAGSWTGTWRKPDGLLELSGVYQAMWVPTADGWRLKNESFVTLACSGSAVCEEMN